jgi:hypothetical protein
MNEYYNIIHKIKRGYVYIGPERKNYTYGRFYNEISDYCYTIRDNSGLIKKYNSENVWFMNNFKLMYHNEWILWSRAVKLRELNEKMKNNEI